jgi:hypothetical protein
MQIGVYELQKWEYIFRALYLGCVVKRSWEMRRTESGGRRAESYIYNLSLRVFELYEVA